MVVAFACGSGGRVWFGRAATAFDWVSVALINFGGVFRNGVAVAKSAGVRAPRMHAKQCRCRTCYLLLHVLVRLQGRGWTGPGMDGDLLTLLLAAIGCRGHSINGCALVLLCLRASPRTIVTLPKAVVRRPISSVTCLPHLAALRTLPAHKSRHRQKAESSAVGHTVIRRSSSRGQE